MAIGRVEGDTLTDDAARRVDDWARRQGVDCVYFLARADEPATAHAAERAGFQLMDVRVQLRQETRAGELAEGVRESRLGDIPALRAIARVSHRTTRFYADPRFPPARCDELYGLWIERSCSGWADVVLVAEHDGAPAGYASCHVHEDARSASIGLTAVAPPARQLGWGRALVESLVSWCESRRIEEITVVTQGRSVGALRLYERCGFRAESLELWFHKWYDG